MNNKMKLVGGAAAGMLALGMIGGGTFAAWSDYQTLEGNSVGADHLTLDLDANNRDGVAQFNNIKMAPGESFETNYYVASRDGDAVPDASLTLTLQNLVGTEDGCRGNLENPDQIANYGTACDGTTVSPFDNAGQFIYEANYWVRSSDPVPVDADCTAYVGRTAHLPNTNNGEFILNDADGVAVNLLSDGVTIQPNEKVCVNVQIHLKNVPAATYNNSAQGDSASFDLRFDLKQV